MFDPHRTRWNDRRYYTRKGQVLQAKKTEVPYLIEPNRVDAYKRYILKNHIVTSADFPSPPPVIPTIDSIKFSEDPTIYPISALSLTTGPVTVAGRTQTIILTTSSADSNYWEVDILFLNDSYATYTIPAGCRYKTFVGSDPVNDAFALYSNNKRLIEIGQNHSRLPLQSLAILQNNFFDKSTINFSDVPA